MRERIIAVIVGWSITGLCVVLDVLLEPSVLADVLGLLAMLTGLSVLLITCLVAAELMSRALPANHRHEEMNEARDRPSEPPTRRAA